MARSLRRLLRRARQSVRVRTTAVAVGLVTLALTLGAWALVTTVHDRLERELADLRDTHIAEVVTQVEAGFAPEDAVAALPVDGVSIDVLAPEVADAVAAGDPAVVGDMAVGGDMAVTIFEAVTPSSDLVAFSAEVSLAEVDRSVTTLSASLRLIVPLMAGAVGVLTWFLTGRALRPVGRMRAELDDISHSSLHRRITLGDAQDEIGRLAGTVNDLLGRLEAAVERQQRFISDASHELRSPLTTISSAVDIAASGSEVVTWPAAGEIVRSETRRLEQIVGDLLFLARLDEHAELDRSDVDLDELAYAEHRRLLLLGRAAATSDIGAARVRGDAFALARLVRNLVDNADRHASSTIAIHLRTEDGHAVLDVDDDGAGIPPDERERVFERFTRLDDSRTRASGGTGLGLSLARSIVQAHDGTIEVSESPLHGARLEVRLPLAPSDPASGAVR